MKNLALLFLLLVFGNLSAQRTDKEAVRKTVETFFEGFHAQDSMVLKRTVTEDIVLQTIAKDSLGNHFVRSEDFSKFVKAIVGIPKETRFEEKLKSFSIQIDGPMANAWTPYEFWLNGTFHHCGVNSFQLVKYGKDWKIVYLIDTRRGEGCTD